MAKSVKEELSKLFSGGKKPNVFYKGLNTDTDAHAIGNDQYTAAVNARLTNSEQDAVTLQNIKSDGTANVLSFVNSNNQVILLLPKLDKLLYLQKWQQKFHDCHSLNDL